MKFVVQISMLVLASFAVASGVDKEEIRGVMKKHLKDMRNCYAAELKNDPKLEGKVVLDWDVNDKGEVTKAEPNKEKTTLKNELALNCMVEKLKSWKFPAAPAGQTVSVSYPFFFSSNR